MAIDFSRYASSQAPGGTQALFQGLQKISDSLGTVESRRANQRQTRSQNKALGNTAYTEYGSGYFNDLYESLVGDEAINSLDSLRNKAEKFGANGGWKDQSTAWTEYLTGLKNVEYEDIDGNLATFDASKKANAMQFATDYKQVMSGLSGQFMGQIEALELNPNVDSNQIQEIFKNNQPFFNYLLQQNPEDFSPGGRYERYVPVETWTDMLNNLKNSGFQGVANDAARYLNQTSGLEAVGIGTAGLGALSAFQNRKFIFDKVSGNWMPQAAKKYAPSIPKSIKFAAGSELAKFGTSEAAKMLGASDKTARDAGLTVSGALKSAGAYKMGADVMTKIKFLRNAINKHGVANILRTVLNRGGWKLGASTLAKLVGGSIGGVLSGGAMTVAMGAWAAKDLNDVFQIITDSENSIKGNTNAIK